MEKTARIPVTNRSTGVVGYTIPDMGNLHRNFQPRETKQIEFGELEALSYLPGGQAVLAKYLIIKDPEALSLLLPSVEPEYNYTEEDIKNIMLTGTLDQFLDTLDFAPAGVVDIIKRLAIELPLNDMSKCNAIRHKTGFDVINALKIKSETEADTEPTKAEAPKRRVETKEADAPKPIRRIKLASKND